MRTEEFFTHAKKRMPRSRQRVCRVQSQHGQAAVEIALLLPILLLILFGVIITGFIFYAHIQVSNAVREGARAGSVYRNDHFDSSGTILTLATVVQNGIYNPSATPPSSALGFLPTSSSNYNVICEIRRQSESYATAHTCGITDPHPGDRVQATIIYSYTVPVVSVALPMFPQPLVMRSSVMMEIQ